MKCRALIALSSFFLFSNAVYPVTGDLGIRPSVADNTLTSLQEMEYVVTSEALPTILDAYVLYLTAYPDFKCLETEPKNVLVRLRNNIDAISKSISARLSWVREVFIVQTDIRGYVSGYFRANTKSLEGSGVPDHSLLFVTTPIKSFKNRVIAICSGVAPESTTIISIDKDLNIELLYDTLLKNNITNKTKMSASQRMYSVMNIRVIKSGVFILEERKDTGTAGTNQPTVEGRTFILDVSKGKFELLSESQGGFIKR